MRPGPLLVLVECKRAFLVNRLLRAVREAIDAPHHPPGQSLAQERLDWPRPAAQGASELPHLCRSLHFEQPSPGLGLLRAEVWTRGGTLRLGDRLDEDGLAHAGPLSGTGGDDGVEDLAPAAQVVV